MSNRSRVLLIGLTVVLLAIVPLGRAVMFTVNEREVAVVLQFGEPVASYTEPGLCFKMPFVQEVRRLPKTYQFWKPPEDEIVIDLGTSDAQKIEVTPWAVWRITDPELFVQGLRTWENAESRVQAHVRSAVRDVITNNELAEAVRSSDRELTYPLLESLEPGRTDGRPSDEEDAADTGQSMAPSPGSGERIKVGREEIVRMIKKIVQDALAQTREGEPGSLGIELVDVGISRIDFVTEVREEAFKRLIAFYESIASRYDNEGEQLKKETINQTNAEVEETVGEGKQRANIIRGEVEAEIIDAYAKAINETGEFYNFIRTLEAYEESLKQNTRLILTTDSGLLQLLQEMTPSPAGSSDKGP